MSKIRSALKKLILVVSVLALGLVALPAVGASAAGLPDQTTPPASQPDNTRLEQAWARTQAIYQREGQALARSGDFISKVQSLIDKATQKGRDTSAVQAALDALTAFIPAAQAAHDPGAVILASHNGFDGSGQVTDRAAAIQTVQQLLQVLKATRTAMDGSLKALHTAVVAFRHAHHPGAGAVTPTP